eukprot:5066142-Amphidinium_carterae.1
MLVHNPTPRKENSTQWQVTRLGKIIAKEKEQFLPKMTSFDQSPFVLREPVMTIHKCQLHCSRLKCMVVTRPRIRTVRAVQSESDQYENPPQVIISNINAICFSETLPLKGLFMPVLWFQICAAARLHEVWSLNLRIWMPSVATPQPSSRSETEAHMQPQVTAETPNIPKRPEL